MEENSEKSEIEKNSIEKNSIEKNSIEKRRIENQGGEFNTSQGRLSAEPDYNTSAYSMDANYSSSETASYSNKLGDKRDFGNFYDLVQERKDRILAFLQKDVLQINNPDLRTFVSLAHAYESLLPYHLFYNGLYEDQVYLKTNILPDMNEVYTDCLKAFGEVGPLCTKPNVKEHGLVCELLLFHEQRYIKINQENVVVKKKAVLNKRNTLIRLRVEDRGCENGVRVFNYRLYIALPIDNV